MGQSEMTKAINKLITNTLLIVFEFDNNYSCFCYYRVINFKIFFTENSKVLNFCPAYDTLIYKYVIA